MTTVNYKLAIEGWPESERIIIRNRMTSPSVIASFPLDFVRRGGDNSWHYILAMVESVVDPEPGQFGLILDPSGLPVDMEASPTGGDFWFESGSQNTPTFTRGPEYFTRFRPPNPEGSYSTRSDSKRSSINQIYMSLLNCIGAPPLFSPSVGLLLRDDLHHAYDRLEWSLYLKIRGL
ncbi:uncharacterized protein LOC62_08G009847 [Vanrija pseudolonga]|uniref:Uncharacterized protein n=1 Tax=Vanrija pseudolonga TaxID=143232 RepID=A0AAF1BRX4_9TREE|nr:hypothetical protein LOC62_08G009846 [Vanrija pseudolonga]WOO86370.1 hypothetical protein LOC62_08G009847 [Vanrija pseudolonga]